jgi:hypothetical protein
MPPLIHQMCGGIHVARPPWAESSPYQGGALLYARLRYFDPVKKRAGLPADTAALVSELSDTGATLTLVNLDTLAPRTVLIQGGAYGEHQFSGVSLAGAQQTLDGKHLTVELAPGAGATLKLVMRRHVNTPTLNTPWASA